MKFLFLSLFFTNFIFAQTLVIDNKEVDLKHFTFEYLQDKSIRHTIETVQKEKFTTIENKKTLHSKKSIWLRTKIYNSSDLKKELYVSYKNIHILRHLYFYTLKDKTVIDSLYYNNFDNIKIDNRIS